MKILSTAVAIGLKSFQDQLTGINETQSRGHGIRVYLYLILGSIDRDSKSSDYERLSIYWKIPSAPRPSEDM